ncbi:hypothetical protein [Collimonas sp.]|uniref:hypothetical protein n=1 Tax=Collimonas sp. TaxID=1963772 RepID=UPI002B790458|nr:hypothetical protein [Collimonas sp.]HWX00505.1 hypothetical protein [Collimonas sp.]
MIETSEYTNDTVLPACFPVLKVAGGRRFNKGNGCISLNALDIQYGKDVAAGR